MLKIFNLNKRKEKREYVVYIEAPDGINYFQGVHEVKLPTKGGETPALFNIWTIHFDDLKEHAGIFTKDEADFYVSNMGIDGCFICTHSEALEKRNTLKN